MFKTHDTILYNTLITLSRNIFFYEKIKLKDLFEIRIYLMFVHFAILMIISKKKGYKFSQDAYDGVFYHIENNLRELGFGDVSVNKKMKDLNKILYDILLKIDIGKGNQIKINQKLLFKYFIDFNNQKTREFNNFENYLINFYEFCFELPDNNMIEDAIKFKF